MKNRRVVEPGSHKGDDILETVRGLHELEAELRRQGMTRHAATCADALRVIKRYRDALKAGA